MKHQVVCLTCEGQGLLPLTRDDKLRCPDCGGTGVMVIYEQRVNPKTIIPVGGSR